jgi:hypothetical protein
MEPGGFLISMSVKEEVKWQDYASCNGIDETNIFFDGYESDVFVAMGVDQLCYHCPVAKQCLEAGLSGEWGVWGGVYLVYGKIDTQRNSHKNDKDWEELKRIHGYSLNECD